MYKTLLATGLMLFFLAEAAFGMRLPSLTPPEAARLTAQQEAGYLVACRPEAECPAEQMELTHIFFTFLDKPVSVARVLIRNSDGRPRVHLLSLDRLIIGRPARPWQMIGLMAWYNGRFGAPSRMFFEIDRIEYRQGHFLARCHYRKDDHQYVRSDRRGLHLANDVYAVRWVHIDWLTFNPNSRMKEDNDENTFNFSLSCTGVLGRECQGANH